MMKTCHHEPKYIFGWLPGRTKNSNCINDMYHKTRSFFQNEREMGSFKIYRDEETVISMKKNETTS